MSSCSLAMQTILLVVDQHFQWKGLGGTGPHFIFWPDQDPDGHEKVSLRR